MKTITLEVDDAVAAKIDEVVQLRQKLGEPTTFEKLAGTWLEVYVGQRLATDLNRFRGMEGAHTVMSRQHGWGTS